MKMFAIFLLLCACTTAQDMKSCPMHKDHQADLEKRGDEGMGFPHDKTTHHFRLYSDGGAIEVTANDSTDDINIKAIRVHLTHVATMFSQDNFSMPMFIHDQVPLGVDVMKEQQNQISYSFEPMPSGARVRIKTHSAEALEAVHDFLRFQIEDHHTGDSTTTSSL